MIKLSEEQQIQKYMAMASPDRLMHWITGLEHGGRNQLERPAHIKFIGDHLKDLAKPNPHKRLIIQLPPRHGKSWTTSWWTPVWYLSLFPQTLVGMATYTANFSAFWGRKVRNTITQYSDLLNVKLSKDSSAAHSWETTMGGGLHTAGASGEFTGRGFGLLIIDDPIRNAEEANSELIRENIWQWYTTTARTRIEPGGSVCLIMTRWHADDLAGRLISEAESGGEPWEIIDLPAIAMEGDQLGREKGEALWPERFDTESLIGKDGEGGLKRAVGPRTWAALYQQRPSLEEGGMFRRSYFRYFEDHEDHYKLSDPVTGYQTVAKSDCWTIMIADTAMTHKSSADYTVIQVWDVERRRTEENKLIGGNMFLVEQWRAQKETPEVEKMLRTMTDRYQPLWIGIEDSPGSRYLIRRLQLLGLRIRPMKADKDKISRATEAEISYAAGRVWHRKGAGYLFDYESELLAFPHGKHDDQVDATSYAAVYSSRHDPWVPPKRPKLPWNSYGKLLGMDKVFGPKPQSSPFSMDQHAGDHS